MDWLTPHVDRFFFPMMCARVFAVQMDARANTAAPKQRFSSRSSATCTLSSLPRMVSQGFGGVTFLLSKPASSPQQKQSVAQTSHGLGVFASPDTHAVVIGVIIHPNSSSVSRFLPTARASKICFVLSIILSICLSTR